MPTEEFINSYASTTLKLSVVGENWTRTKEQLIGTFWKESPEDHLEILVAEVFVMHLPLWDWTSPRKQNELLNISYTKILGLLEEEYGYSKGQVATFWELFMSRYGEYVELSNQGGILQKY